MLVYQEGIRVLLTLVDAKVEGMVLRLCQEILDIVVKQSVMSEMVLRALRKEVELDRYAKMHKAADAKSTTTASKSNIHSDYLLRNSSQGSSSTSEEYVNKSVSNNKHTQSDNAQNSSGDEDNDSTADECDEDLESSDADIHMQEEVL